MERWQGSGPGEPPGPDAAQAPASIVRPDGIEPDAVMRVLRVPPEAAGMRLDRFVQGQLRRTSRTRCQAIVLRGAYDLAGRRMRKNRRVRAEERIVLWRPAWDEAAPALELPVLFEDEHLLAIDKPPHVPVHPTARYHHSTVVKLLERQRSGERPTLLHRLDRETSGVLLLARTPEADRAVKRQFELRGGVLKRYLAIAWGCPEQDRFRCEVPLERDDGGRYARIKMRPAAAGTGLSAVTTFEVLGRRRRPGTEQRYALLLCTLHTGRQHQIRVHLSQLGLPVVGDKLYGPDESLLARAADGVLGAEDQRRLELGRHALHAVAIEIDHPAHGGRLHIEAPLYPDLDTFWRRLEPP
ncbi:MAG: RluA family pseudouridine synthase [Deltaproteobacteria bacterium]|nr:RluA family pseudouridine synthase [Deltaproteobacteria bacterium]